MAKKRDMLTRFRSAWYSELTRLSADKSALRVTRKTVTEYMTAAGFVTSNGEPVWDASKISKFLSGKVGASLDECVALAAAVGTSLDDLLSLDSSTATLRQRLDDEWERIVTSLQEISNREFDILTAKSSFVRTLEALEARGELSEVPRDFERLWNLIEFYLSQHSITMVDGERALHLSDEERVAALFRALKNAYSEKELAEVQERYLELSMHVYVDELVQSGDRGMERFALENTLSSKIATIAEKSAADRDLKKLKKKDVEAAKAVVKRYREGERKLR